MPPSRVLAVLGLLIPLAGCHTTYYAYPHGVGGGQQAFTISAGRDTGASGDEVPFVHPELVAHLCAQPESAMHRYYRMMVAHAFRGGAYRQQALRELQTLLPLVQQTAAQDEAQALVRLTEKEGSGADVDLAATAFARAAGRHIAPYLIWSISEYGYARWSWGSRIEEDLSDFRWTVTGLRLTAHRDLGQIKLHSTPPLDVFAPMQVVTLDVATADDDVVWEPHDAQGDPLRLLDPAEDLLRVCQQVRPLRPEDWKACRRLDR